MKKCACKWKNKLSNVLVNCMPCNLFQLNYTNRNYTHIRRPILYLIASPKINTNTTWTMSVSVDLNFFFYSIIPTPKNQLESVNIAIKSNDQTRSFCARNLVEQFCSYPLCCAVTILNEADQTKSTCFFRPFIAHIAIYWKCLVIVVAPFFVSCFFSFFSL